MTQQTMTAWVEIPVSDLEASVAFYDGVFGWTSTISNDMGPNAVAVFNNAMDAAGGQLYPGKPANGTGSTTHLTISGTVEAAAERVVKLGGEIVGPVVDIPPGRFQYALDLDGNSIGLFEPKVA